MLRQVYQPSAFYQTYYNSSSKYDPIITGMSKFSAIQWN